VIRDERLGIVVVRCPECGKWHPAGIATGAGRVWLNRLAAWLITWWVIFLVVAVVVFGLASGGLDAVKIEGFIQYQQDWFWVPLVAGSPEGATAMWVDEMLVNAGSCVLGLLAGMGMAVFLSHLKRRWVAVLAVVPLLALLVVYYEDRDHWKANMEGYFLYRLGLEFGLQCAGLAVGVMLGRPVARGVLRVVLSRRMLQYVRVLWEVDGKAAPGIKAK
jgi:hypothetical protein